MTPQFLFLALVLNSLFIAGLHIIITFEGMIFEPIGDWLIKVLPNELSKPLFNCMSCMASIWGFPVALYLFGISFAIIPYCIALCGLNTLISKILYHE